MAPTPTLHVPLNGNLNGTDNGAPIVADGYGALRYRASDIGGRQCALVEVGATNYVANPYAALDVSNWSASATSNTRVTTLPGALTGVQTANITTGVLKVLTSGSAGNMGGTAANLPSGGDHAFSLYVWIPTAFSSDDFYIRMNNYVGSSNYVDGFADMGKRDQWQRLVATLTVGADLIGNPAMFAGATPPLIGEQFWVTAGNVVAGSFAGSSIPELDSGGNLLTGYAWTGTPHASSSTRALTTIEIPYTGAVEHILFRYSEDFGATWATASMTADGTFGSYGSIDYTSNIFTIESSRALMIRNFAVYADELTAGQLAAAEAAVANGTIGRRSGNTAGLLLPV